MAPLKFMFRIECGKCGEVCDLTKYAKYDPKEASEVVGCKKCGNASFLLIRKWLTGAASN